MKKRIVPSKEKKLIINEISKATILEHAPCGVTVQDNNGKLIFANKRAADISGFSTVSQLLTATTEKIIKRFSGMDNNGKPYNSENFPGRQILKGKDYAEDIVYFTQTNKKEEHWVTIKASPIYEGKNRIGVINIFYDVTNEKKLEKNRDIFVAMASHELKSLLTSIKAYIQLLQRIKQKDPQKNNLYLSRLDGQITRLTSLITDFMDLSRIKAGMLSLEKERVNINMLIAEIVTDMQIVTKQKITIKGKYSKKLLIDRKKIEEVLVNFLNNAIKYAPKSKEIVIKIEKQKKACRISVIDDGPGVKQKDQEKIFDLFYQLKDNEPMAAGLGIGLFIAKNIIRAHGGEIGVISKRNKGSTFFITLPNER